MIAKHSPTVMVRLCFALFLLSEREDRIDMPRRLMENLEGEVIDEELYECALGKDILSADDTLFLKVVEYHVFETFALLLHINKVL